MGNSFLFMHIQKQNKKDKKIVRKTYFVFICIILLNSCNKYDKYYCFVENLFSIEEYFFRICFLWLFKHFHVFYVFNYIYVIFSFISGWRARSSRLLLLTSLLKALKFNLNLTKNIMWVFLSNKLLKTRTYTVSVLKNT